MSLILPTDTEHITMETRQYELFNRPLGQGISRRKMAVTAAVCTVWSVLMIAAGVSLFSRFGPTIYIVPPFAFTFLGTKSGDDGRMNLILWYDALLAKLPSRRRVIRNPLLNLSDYAPEPIQIRATAELQPRTKGLPLTPLHKKKGAA